MEDIYIGNIKLDMQFYSGLDEYSDGDIEEKMLRIVRDSHDIEIECYKFSGLLSSVKRKGTHYRANAN